MKVVFSFASRNRFWFGMMISVSTWPCSSSTPFSACFIRREPSNWKGLVTTPTVRMPISRAALAMIGAAPVPVPPPMPAVMKHMWQPLRLLDDLLDRLLGRGGADLGPGAGAEALGDAGAELQLVAGPALRQRLGVGVRDDELAALERLLDHVVDRVAAGAADADHGDPGAEVLGHGNAECQCHLWIPPVVVAAASAPPRGTLV